MHVLGSQPKIFSDRFLVHVLGSQVVNFQSLKGQTDSSFKMCAICQALFTLQTDGFLLQYKWIILALMDI